MKKKDLRKEIINSFNGEDDINFYLRPEYAELIRATMYSLLKDTDYEGMRLYLNDNPKGTASTDGREVNVSVCGPFSIGNKYEKYISHLGLICHECGHLLYTEFDGLNALRKSFYDMNFSRQSRKVARNHTDMFKRIYFQALCSMTNIIEDKYIEKCLSLEFDGLVMAGITHNNKTDQKFSKTNEELEQQLVSKELFPIHAFNYILHANLTFDGLKGAVGENLKKVYEVYDDLKEIIKSLEDYLPIELKKEKLIKIADAMYSLMPTESSYDDIQNPNQGSNDDSSNLKTSKKDNLKSDDENNLNSEYLSLCAPLPDERGHGRMPVEKEKTRSLMEKDYKNAFENEVKKVAGKISSRLMDEMSLEEALNQAQIKGESHPIRIISTLDSNCYKKEYRAIKNEVKTIAGRTARRIENMFKHKEDDCYSDGFLIGSRFNAKDVYRNDGHYFSKYHGGDEIPDVAFTLLIDHSGSMNGDTPDGTRCEVACKAAIALYEMCKELDKPVAVYTHHDDGKVSTIEKVVGFNDDSAFTNLACAYSRGSTCDSAAIMVASEELLKREEKDKILIVISDGYPNVFALNKKDIEKKAFHNVRFKKLDSEHISETNAIVRYYKKQSVKIYGLALYEYERIMKIYEETAIDCSNLSRLPEKVARIFKRHASIR